MADTKASTKRTGSATASGNVLSDEERAAMQETIREGKNAAKLTPEVARPRARPTSPSRRTTGARWPC